MMRHNYILIPILMLALCTACNSSKEKASEGSAQELLPDWPAEVTVITLTTTDFDHLLLVQAQLRPGGICIVHPFIGYHHQREHLYSGRVQPSA